MPATRGYIIFDNEGEFVTETIYEESAKQIADIFSGYVRDAETLSRVYDTAVSLN
jgi:hypothetical protein